MCFIGVEIALGAGLEIGLAIWLDTEPKIGFETGLGPSQDWRLVRGEWTGNLREDWTGERYGIWYGDWRLDWVLWAGDLRMKTGDREMGIGECIGLVISESQTGRTLVMLL